MAKQTFGGDDDEEEAPQEEKKQKLDLSKYSAGPDVNIRGLFWDIMGSYAAKGQPGADLGALEMDRFALVRAAIGALHHPSPLHARLTPNHIARYTLMMILDAEWQDIFAEFLEECEQRNKRSVLLALRKLGQGAYSERVIAYLRAMLRYRESSETALRYLKELGIAAIASELKKELIILARGDIGENQLNAISALSLLQEDEDVAKTLAVLLSHWDDEARMAAATALQKMKTGEAASVARKRLESESDPDIRKILEKIAG